MSWAFGELIAFDVETTGTDVETARIVTAAAAHIVPGAETATDGYLVAVDVDIPAEATEVHGITTEHARENGKPAAEVLEVVAASVAESLAAEVPLVGMNVAFDLTVLDRELRRNSLPTLEDRLGRPVAPVIDVYVIDKALDRYRRGSRKLGDLCTFYGVRLDDAHDAAADALAAARVAYNMCRRGGLQAGVLERLYGDRPRQAPHIAAAFQRLAGMTLGELHEAQRGWYREQAESLAAYFRQKANEEEARAGRTVDAAAHELVMADVERLRERADSVLTEWPMAGFRP